MSIAKRALAASVLVPLVLWGCAVGPDFLRPDPPTADRYTADPLPVQTASAAVGGGAAQHFAGDRDIQGDWWVLFRSPALDALIKEAIEANPNPRYFPPAQVWFPTWDVGAQLTWSPNDVLTANGSVTESRARAASLEANKATVRDGIQVEVTQYWQNVHQADFAIEASTRELASAQEAYRVARELFNNGRGTSTTLTDAETDLTRARLDLLNAKADAHIARVQLEHALGRDVRP